MGTENTDKKYKCGECMSLGKNPCVLITDWDAPTHCPDDPGAIPKWEETKPDS